MVAIRQASPLGGNDSAETLHYLPRLDVSSSTSPFGTSLWASHIQVVSNASICLTWSCAGIGQVVLERLSQETPGQV